MTALEEALHEMRLYSCEGNVKAALRLNEQVITLFLDAVFDQDRDALAQFRSRFAAFRSEMLAAVGPNEGAELNGALSANLMFATLASRRRPKGIKVQLDAEASSARDGVLMALKRERSLGTRDLADKVGVRPETMSRTLTALKAEGLVTSRRAGRSILSRLTPRGMKAVGLSSQPNIGTRNR